MYTEGLGRQGLGTAFSWYVGEVTGFTFSFGNHESLTLRLSTMAIFEYF